MNTQKVVFVNKELNTRMAGLLRLPDGFDIHDGFSCQFLFLRQIFAGCRGCSETKWGCTNRWSYVDMEILVPKNTQSQAVKTFTDFLQDKS